MDSTRKMRVNLKGGSIYKLVKNLLSIFFLAVILLNFGSGAWAGGPSQSVEPLSPPKISSDRVIVKFKKKFLPDIKNLKAGIPSVAVENLKKKSCQGRSQTFKTF